MKKLIDFIIKIERKLSKFFTKKKIEKVVEVAKVAPKATRKKK